MFRDVEDKGFAGDRIAYTWSVQSGVYEDGERYCDATIHLSDMTHCIVVTTSEIDGLLDMLQKVKAEINKED